MRWSLYLSPLVAALWFGLWPELEELTDPPIPGEIVFRSERPPLRSQSTDGSGGLASATGVEGKGGWSMDWLYDRFDDVMAWEHNPWQRNPEVFGSHYFRLQEGGEPSDPRHVAHLKELRRLGELLYQRVLERYPELAVLNKDVPPEKNGFLKWLEFRERFDADPSRPGGEHNKEVGFPDALKKHLNGEGPWDAAAMKAWLTKEKSLLNEIRAIGLMEEQSIVGIDPERWHFMSARLAKSSAEALLLEARLSAEEGNMAAALESVRAANGLADHFVQIETPTLLNATVEILIRRQVQRYALSEIIPAAPLEQFDAEAWEQAVNPVVSPPSELARMMVGEWNLSSRWWLMPMLSNTDDPKYPSDPDALIDYHATGFVETASAYSGQSPADWDSVVPPLAPGNMSHLSRESRQLMELMFIGAEAWSGGFQKSTHQAGMTQAAFAIMKGDPIPNDPVYGLPYQWDPVTRELKLPDGAEFRPSSVSDSITVPSTDLR
ncbi:hypothetical protein [Haloferula sp.]|uniref:hypothetical protein n=1 Tax=Haloferula sp. TaxID=2497595 RepID=UPI00329DBF3A